MYQGYNRNNNKVKNLVENETKPDCTAWVFLIVIFFPVARKKKKNAEIYCKLWLSPEKKWEFKKKLRL